MSEDSIVRIIISIPAIMGLLFAAYLIFRDVNDTKVYIKTELFTIGLTLKNIRRELEMNHMRLNPSATDQDVHEWEILQVKLLVERIINVNLNEKNTKDITRVAEILRDKYLEEE